MKTKILTIIFGMIFLVGLMAVVTAERELSYMQGIDINNFVAGNEVTANFSYYYLDLGENVDNSPWILQFNITSQNESYPVWRGDFEMNGYIRRCKWDLIDWCLFGEEIIPFECSDESNQIIEHPLGSEPIIAENGTFYCYNHTTDLNLNRYDNIFLNIQSLPALYPGDYELSAKVFYLNDTYSPIVEILNKEYFENVYYTRGNEINEILVNISDVNLNTDSLRGKILADGQNFTDFSWYKTNDVYHFTKEIPSNMPEGDWELRIIAEDIFGYLSYDNMTLKIDNTPPDIIAIQPTGEIYEEIIPIKLNVTDRKAGVNTDEVYYRIREMNGSNICPYDGFGTWDCYDSGWVKIDLNSGNFISGNYTDTFDTGPLESGEYWFEAKAEDLLENVGVLE